MKKLPLAIVTALTVGLVLLAGTAEARATRIPFTMEALNCTITSPGTVTYADGNVHIRGFIQECDHLASIPQLVGTDTMVINANWDATGSGPVWMTWRLETDGVEGGWEGVWQGTATGFGTGGTGKGVGHGTGIYEGQQFFSDSVSVPGGAISTGYILVP